MRDEDLELLDVLQQLEEQNGNEQHIDLDSSLAPLSQPHKNCTTSDIYYVKQNNHFMKFL